MYPDKEEGVKIGYTQEFEVRRGGRLNKNLQIRFAHVPKAFRKGISRSGTIRSANFCRECTCYSTVGKKQRPEFIQPKRIDLRERDGL